MLADSGRDNLNIWCDPWVLGVDHFSPRLKPGALVGRHTNLGSDLICDDSFEWNVQLIRNIFNTPSADAILQIKLPAHPGVDSPIWMKDPKGRLTLKAAYNFILQDRVTSTGGLAKEDWQILWQLKIQHRLKLVLWKVIVKALPIRGKLRFGQVGDGGAGLCPLF